MEVDAEVGVAGIGVGEQVVGDGEDLVATATRARLVPRRFTIRR